MVNGSIILTATTEHELDTAFKTMTDLRAGALLVAADPFFNSRREYIVALAARYGIPAMYEQREFALAGGLMSYGTNPPPTAIARPAYTLGGCSKARSLQTCPSSNQPNSSS